eukprot:CAMPEP_0170514982 /NCGR_PEP_ID=MMETSP0209-20121228/1473_1 /TAXON_ID=665100 ORGANISM="Litonotus pictus, Strain P1" /NCGR_SAMPLE_ID=MMETSP0209 /ASSEMBLY_ACC=CAM_ASM_000301 /LENGTH=144 /DNA_ID=CAMNT_0010799267 /DNA_START=24 /DNA_END=458 /DNA_ORIENTATION=+
MNDITEYKAAFTLFDKENKGLITVSDTKKLIRSLGQNFSEKELNDIVHVFHKDQHRKGVELHEFLDLMAKYRQSQDNNDSLLVSFKYFDKEDSGKINYNEFSHTLSTLNEKLSLEEIKLLDDYCHVSNGQFEYADLLNAMLDIK